jgi:hypothetical protein
MWRVMWGIMFGSEWGIQASGPTKASHNSGRGTMRCSGR